MQQLQTFGKKHGVAIILLLLIALSFSVRSVDYHWPYLRNIDSYAFARQMGDIVENNGILPNLDELSLSPTGASRAAGMHFYVYLGAYSFMLYNAFVPGADLFKFLVPFPAMLASLMVIPIYFLGKRLYNKKAGLIAAFFIVFDISVMARSLAGDPDSDAIVLFVPLIVITALVISHQVSERDGFWKKKTLFYSVLAVIATVVWSHTWGGYWFIIWLFTGFVILKLLLNFVKEKKMLPGIKRSKNSILHYVFIMVVFFILTVPYFGTSIIFSTYQNPFVFGNIKMDTVAAGIGRPNVYVSVAELQNPGGIQDIIQRTSPISFQQIPLAVFVAPFFLAIYALLYLGYSALKTGKHVDTFLLLIIWIFGPLTATIIAVRFSILFSAPIALGSGIILAKIWQVIEGEKFYE